MPTRTSSRAKPAAAVPPADAPHTLTGEFRVHDGFHSEFLEHDRSIIVRLPDGYDATGARRYPVLYLHDGQNVFDRATSVGDEWGVDEAAQALAREKRIEPLIIVGIYNTGEHRIDEYAPTADEVKGGGGGADAYGRMLVQEIKPLVDREYKTLPGAPSTGLGGSSLGGLLTLHLGLAYPTVFSRLAVLSPSIWWDDRVILKTVEAVPAKLPLRIWLDAGTGEGEETTANARLLRDALVAKGWTVDGDLRYFEMPGGEHNERSWAARVGPMLEYLYPPNATPSNG